MDDVLRLSAFRAYLVPVIILSVLGLVLFCPAGSLKFWEAWIWWLLISTMTLFITAYFLRKAPDLLSRRAKFKEKEPQPMAVRILSFLSLLTYVVPGVDYRFHWSSVPVWLVMTADLLVLSGYIFIFLVFKENSYASTVIQVDKGQAVIQTGPYALVRHPMYAGLLIMQLFTPFALGSYWAFLFAWLFVPTLFFRIKQEEDMLLRDLPSYKDYTVKVPHRLIPSIW